MSDTQTLSFENFPVTFQNDGYLNATAVAEHFGKRVSNYLKTERTKEYIEALLEMLSQTIEDPVVPKRAFNENQQVTEYGFVNSEENQHTGNPISLSPNALKRAFKENQGVAECIPVNYDGNQSVENSAPLVSNARKSTFKENQVVIVREGAPETGGGTWLHPKLAVDFARWLNPKFAVWCDEQITRIMTGGRHTAFREPQPTLTHLQEALKFLAWRRGMSYEHAALMLANSLGMNTVEDLQGFDLQSLIKQVNSYAVFGAPKPNAMYLTEEQVGEMHHLVSMVLDLSHELQLAQYMLSQLPEPLFQRLDAIFQHHGLRNTVRNCMEILLPPDAYMADNYLKTLH